MQAPAFSTHQKEDEKEEGYYQIVVPFLDAFFIATLPLIRFNEFHDTEGLVLHLLVDIEWYVSKKKCFRL